MKRKRFDRYDRAAAAATLRSASRHVSSAMDEAYRDILGIVERAGGVSLARGIVPDSSDGTVTDTVYGYSWKDGSFHEMGVKELKVIGGRLACGMVDISDEMSGTGETRWHFLDGSDDCVLAGPTIVSILDSLWEYV